MRTVLPRSRCRRFALRSAGASLRLTAPAFSLGRAGGRSRLPLLSLLLCLISSSLLAGSVLRAGDPVELRISGVPSDEQTQVNNVYTVDANGMVNMPYINKVRAVGLTPAQLASAIEGGYRSARIFTNPTITIVMQAQTRFVNVGGAVRAPARVPFTEDMTLLSALSAAGGFNDFADQKRVRVLRGSEAKVYDVRQFRREPGLDPKLQPGDRIEVPQSFF